MGQMAASLGNRPQESLPNNTEKNLKEQAITITLRSGKQVKQLQSQNTNAESLYKAKKNNREETKKSEDNESNS